tara:strand:- start:22443 stop:23444 length:1002 start_codon:yes stop_codon:yes gene_type:complete
MLLRTMHGLRATGIVLCLVFSRHAHAAADPGQSEPYTLENVQQFDLKSERGQIYRVSIALPSAKKPETGFPVIYVLDPDTAFATLLDSARAQAFSLGPAVIVGVGYPKPDTLARTFDLTPSDTDRSSLPASRFDPPYGPTGGAEHFRKFLVESVKPEVERRVAIDRNRQALFGHSFGGLFVLDTLFSTPDAFNTYVAGSPSVWWSDRLLLRKARGFIQDTDRLSKRRLLVTVGLLEQSVEPFEDRAIRASATPKDADELSAYNHGFVRNAAMVDGANAIADILDTVDDAALCVRLDEISGEGHMSVIPAYLSRGLRFSLLSGDNSRRPDCEEP